MQLPTLAIAQVAARSQRAALPFSEVQVRNGVLRTQDDEKQNRAKSVTKPIAFVRAMCAVLAVGLFPLAAEAMEVQIDDFVFGCETPGGEVLKPQFGDMNGVFYTEIRGQEKACEAAVKRRIANCHQHTRFLSPGDNEKYPECLPIFEEQAGRCMAFFRKEIAKCRAGGTATEARLSDNDRESYSADCARKLLKVGQTFERVKTRLKDTDEARRHYREAVRLAENRHAICACTIAEIASADEFSAVEKHRILRRVGGGDKKLDRALVSRAAGYIERCTGQG